MKSEDALSKTIVVRFTEDEYNGIVDVARRTNHSVSWVVRWATNSWFIVTTQPLIKSLKPYGDIINESDDNGT